MRERCSTLVSILLLWGCSLAPTAPGADSLDQPTFANNPDNGNLRIVRFGEVAGFVIIDPTTNRFSLHAGTNRQFGCNVPPQLFAVEDVQWIVHDPDDPMAGQINEVRVARDLFIAIFEGFDAWDAGGRDCADLFARKLAEGTGNLTNTDNDVFTFLFDDPRRNHNAYGFAAQGRLTLASGETRPYSGVSRCVWDGDDAASERCVARVSF